MANIIGYNNNVMFNTAGQPFYCVPSTGGKKGEYTAAGDISTDGYYYWRDTPLTGVENIPNISTYTADGSWSSASKGQVYFKLNASDFVSARISGYADFDAYVYPAGSRIRVGIQNTIDTGKTSAYTTYNWTDFDYFPLTRRGTIYDCYWKPKSAGDDLILRFTYTVDKFSSGGYTGKGYAELKSFNYRITACTK